MKSGSEMRSWENKLSRADGRHAKPQRGRGETSGVNGGRLARNKRQGREAEGPGQRGMEQLEYPPLN